jgi:hypothetical protein
VATLPALRALQRLADRSFEGRSMSAYLLDDDGIDPEVVRELEGDGLIEVRDSHGEPTVTLTDAGLAVLTPKRSSSRSSGRGG